LLSLVRPGLPEKKPIGRVAESPGGGAIIASFGSYAIEKRLSGYPEKFGAGVIEGVAAPESAHNAAAQVLLSPS